VPEEPYSGAFKVLILSTVTPSTEFHHDSIPDCQEMIADLGSGPMPEGTKPDTSFSMKVANDDLSDFTDENLKNYGMLFWCNPLGTVFSSGGTNGKIGMAAIQKFVENGGAWGGVHSASDFEKTNGFRWYTNTLLGAYYDHHDVDGTPGTVLIQDEFASHPVVRGLDASWSVREEWFYMNRDLPADSGFKILAKLAKDQRPVIWIKELGTNLNGRMFYTIRGHNKTVYQEPEFRRLILNGILWATHRLD
jgi:type 1 glutamine amidotransferase